MIVSGLDSVQALIESDGYLFKMVANDTAAYFFPYTTEHRDAKLPGLSCEDDSAGNAMAAMIKPGRIEFRFHRAFFDAHVCTIAQRILDHPDASFASGFTVTYQGRTLLGGS